MKIEIRSDTLAIVSGYVNAVERLSKPISLYGRRFRERVREGVFGAAIKRAAEEKRSIILQIDHDKKNYADTQGGTLELREDNIGLWAQAEIRDAGVIADMKANGVQGWSFGMKVTDCKYEKTEGETEIRNILEMVLSEVSILIHKRPAYSANSIEVRAGEEDAQAEEIRGCEDAGEIEEKEKPEENKGNENRDEADAPGENNALAYKLKTEILKFKGAM